MARRPESAAAPDPAPATATGVFPPSFCNWRVVLAMLVLAQLAVFMVALGRLASLSVQWAVAASLYGYGLALMCAAGLCVIRPWLSRMPPRHAWVSCWLATVIMAFTASYCAGVVGTVLGFGPGRHGLAGFMIQTVLSVALVGAALIRYLYIRAQWLAEVTAQAEARVQALQARIRPHFLFNSLNTIASLVPEQPEAAERAIEDLADLFRGGMRRADRLIPLEEELSLARKYLDMEQRRLGERLQVGWRVEELPSGAQVLPMILQPLLENAVAHGVQNRPAGGQVELYGRREENRIVITITNPVGAPAHRGRPSENHHGMALRNIRQRLELAWGDRASLITQQDDEQFFAVVTLPYVERTDHR